MPRLLKQFIYGFLFIFVIGAVGYGVKSLFSTSTVSCFDGIQNQGETGIDCGGSCVSCEIKNLSPFTVKGASFPSSNGGPSSFVLEIKNPNKDYGAESFKYFAIFYNGKGAILKTIERESFIYAGETKLLVEANIDVGGEIITNSEVTFSDIKWKKKSEGWDMPVLPMELKTEKSGDVFAVSGFVKNDKGYEISKIVVNAILVDMKGKALGVGKTEMENIQPFEEKNFYFLVNAINPSLNKEVDLKGTKSYIETKR
ncbi:MAG: hypothetical protein PHN74_03110 [Candidatus Pacebacteria bacterium]|nr:hypothetical protein [Candidatus Paceibacterota bacterium]